MNLGSFVGLADYNHLQRGDSINGGAFANPNVVNELRKALATNAAVGTDGSALIPQSLETTLKVVTYRMKEIKLWQRIVKRPAYNTVEEFNQLLEYGLGESAFIAEGGLPAEDNSQYVRQTGLVKFLGTVRSVTHPMTLVNTTVGNVIDLEDTNGTMHLLRLLEVALFYGDSALNPLSFDGLKKILMTQAEDNVIDLRGKPITDKIMESIDQRIALNYGEIDVLYMSTKAKADLSRNLMKDDLKRIILPSAGGMTTNLGATVDRYKGNNSEFDLDGHKFIRENVPYKTSIPQSISARVAGQVGNVLAAAASAGGNFTRLEAGTYTYRVAAVNSFGEGLASNAVTIAQAVAAGDLVNVTIPTVQGALFYRVYRNRVGETTLYLMDEIADSGQATTVYADRGLYIPGTSCAFGLFTDGDQGMSWKQLAPLMKLPLAQIDTSMRWAILLYGFIQMYQPRKQIILLNVGSTGMPAQPEAEADPALATFLRTL